MYYKDLLRHRQCWLGVALIWIIFYHSRLDFGLLEYLKSIGYGGVDICIFASGIGCFYSLSNESNVATFMKRRLKRLVPTYLIFIIVWLIYQYIIGNFGLQMAIGNIFAVQNFTGHEHAFNWYISAIFLFYILAPYFKAIAEHTSHTLKFIFLIFLLAFSIPFWNSNTYIITITRLPLFFIGMLFANICKKDHEILSWHVFCMIIAFIIGAIALTVSVIFIPQYMWSCGIYWYPFILITPPLCLAISYISTLLEKTKLTKPIISLLSLCGKYSFELYLVHILLISLIYDFIRKFGISKNNCIVWIISIILLVISCYLLRFFTILITKVFTNYLQKNIK